MAPTMTIKVDHVFRHPLAQAFEWLTDYDDDDPKRTGAVVKGRRVLERTDREVKLDATVEVMGVTSHRQATVTLHPPDRWVATTPGRNGPSSVFEYRLTPIDGGRACRLDVAYTYPVRSWVARLKLRLVQGRIRKQLKTMWSGFERSMDQDLALTATH